jgi:RNA recognition motif-containing protein
VNESHLLEIFSTYGQIVDAEIVLDRVVKLPVGYGLIEFRSRDDAAQAIKFMDGAQIDGNVVQVKLEQPPQKPASRRSPPRRYSRTLNSIYLHELGLIKFGVICAGSPRRDNRRGGRQGRRHSRDRRYHYLHFLNFQS